MISQKSIRIPIADSTDFVEVFPDELPADVNDLLDVLKAEFAPLKIWRAAAVEYYRQQQLKNFENVLNEIISNMNPDIEKEYRKRGEYKDGIVEIFDTLAAYALYQGQNSDGPEDRGRREEIKDHLAKSEAVKAFNEYTFIIRGFDALYSGDIPSAELCFKNIHTKASKSSDKRIYLHGSLLGLGAVAYSKEKYPQALEFFIKAVQRNPGCGASVRVAIATCAFKLAQYDRCRSAVERALDLDPSNVDALVLLALLERMESQKSTAAQRQEHRANARDLFLLASKIDPKCSMALNHVANHSFYSWNTVDPEATVVSPTQIRAVVGNATNGQSDTVPAADMVSVGDILQIEKMHIFRVTEVRCERQTESDKSYLFTTATEVPSRWIGKRIFVETKDAAKVNEVNNLTAVVIKSTNVRKIRAESYYILGRLYHMLRDFNIAFQCYEEALENDPTMPLATFGIAQLHLGRDEFAASLDKFQEVLKQYPDDRDTQAYVMLLKSILNKEHVAFDKLREIAPGFLFEADLWLSQGESKKSSGPAEYGAALKCFEMALECMERQGLTPHRQVFLNMGVLYHSMGNLKAAKKFVCHSLSTPSEDIAENDEVNPIFHRLENDIFYTWSEAVCSVEAFTPAELQQSKYGECYFKAGPEHREKALSSLFKLGDDLLVGDFIVQVVGVEDDNLHCVGMITVPLGVAWEVKKKIPGSNFNRDTITNCFNLARIQEDLGNLQAAREIYIELLKKHPCFIECHLRLSLMARDIGRLEEATQWAKQALAIDPTSKDAVIIEADLLEISQKWDSAKSQLESICRPPDNERAMVSLGNFYFSNVASKATLEKESMKFYHSVLREDRTNVYAANGLGMICAQKGQNDVARDIFSRAREAGMQMSNDICVNLGHINMRQGRLTDAGILYQASLRALPSSPSVCKQCDSIVAVSDCLALSYFRNQQYDDSVRVVLRSLHYDPTRLHDWYNVAYVKEEQAVKLCRQNKAAALKNESLCIGEYRHEKFRLSKVSDHEKFCSDTVEKAKLHLAKAEAEEIRLQGLRAQQQQEHQRIMALRNEEKERELEARRKAREDQQELARQKHKEFELLKESWTTAAQASGERKSKKKKGKADFADDDPPGEDASKPFESDSDGDGIASPAGRALTGSGEDFGSHASTKSDHDDVFGSSDSEEEFSAPNSTAESVSKKRTMPSGESSSDEELDFKGDGSEAVGVSSRPNKQRRVVDDEEDE